MYRKNLLNARRTIFSRSKNTDERRKRWARWHMSRQLALTKEIHKWSTCVLQRYCENAIAQDLESDVSRGFDGGYQNCVSLSLFTVSFQHLSLKDKSINADEYARERTIRRVHIYNETDIRSKKHKLCWISTIINNSWWWWWQQQQKTWNQNLWIETLKHKMWWILWDHKHSKLYFSLEKLAYYYKIRPRKSSRAF